MSADPLDDLAAALTEQAQAADAECDRLTVEFKALPHGSEAQRTNDAAWNTCHGRRLALRETIERIRTMQDEASER